MPNILAIAARELKSYFNAPIAYIYTTVFLVFMSWYFFRIFFLEGQADMRVFFAVLPWVYLFLVPAMTMRFWAEERKLGTVEILLTLPISETQAVLGKFVAGFSFLAISVLLTAPVPITVFALGHPDPGPIIGGYLGALLMGAAYLAIGLCCSSFTENQIVAFIFGVVLTFTLFVVGEDFILAAAPGAIAPVMRYLGLGYHYRSILRGVVDTRDIVYYLSVVIGFLYLNTKVLENRKL